VGRRLGVGGVGNRELGSGKRRVSAWISLHCHDVCPNLPSLDPLRGPICVEKQSLFPPLGGYGQRSLLGVSCGCLDTDVCR